MGKTMKRPELTVSSVFYIILFIAGLVVIIGGMMHARTVLIPLMMAIFIAIISHGPMIWFQEKGFPQWLALFLIMALFCCLVIIAVLVAGASMKDFIHNVPEYESKLHQQTEQLTSFLSSKGVHLKGKGIANLLNPASAMKYAGELLSGLGNLLANGFVIVLIVVFMLAEASGFPAKFKAVYGGDDRKSLQFQIFRNSVKEYMKIKSLVSLATGVLATLSLLAIGVDYPVMWGMLAFALNFIPSIGSIIAAVPPVLLAIVQIGPGSALVVAICYLSINVVMGNVVEPRFMGKGLGLSTLVVFLSLLFWGWVLGPVGMLLSVVLTMKLKIMFDSNEETQWLGPLLGPNPTEEKL
jgi:AI-2 transport protein TqsA